MPRVQYLTQIFRYGRWEDYMKADSEADAKRRLKASIKMNGNHFRAIRREIKQTVIK